MFDVHAHIQLKAFNRDREDVIRRAVEKGVRKILVVGFDIETSKKAIALARRYSGLLFAAIGIHPHDARTLSDEAKEEIRELANHKEVVAIGETGLDFYRNLSPKDDQEEAFRFHIELSIELQKPLIVHCRRAYREVLSILREYKGLDLRFVLHSFNGPLELIEDFIDLGAFFSISGPVTYPSAEDLRQKVRFIPLEFLMVETDCPWLPPQPFRGRRNEPSFVSYVATEIAKVKKAPLEEVCRVTTRNAERLFGIRVEGGRQKD